MASSAVPAGNNGSGASSENGVNSGDSRSNVSPAAFSSRVPTLVNSPVSKSWGRTQVQLAKFEFTWTINNFSFVRKEVGEKLVSPNFPSGPKNELVWRVEAFPMGDSEESTDYLGLYLQLMSCDYKTDALTKYRLSILNAKGKKSLSASNKTGVKFFPESGKTGWGFSKFIRLDFLRNEANGLLPGDNLTIFCEGSTVLDSVVISGLSSVSQTEIPEWSLSENLGCLLENREFSDVAFSVDSKDLHAHKNILSARSPVFAAMFKYEMKESQQNRVVITDTKYEVFKEMLAYVYTGKSQNLVTMAEDLLAVADKYDLGGLKNVCETVLCSTLTVANALDLLVLADMHCAKKLKSQAIRFMHMRNEDIVLTPAWKTTSSTHPHVIIEVLEAIATQSLPARHSK